MCNICSDMCNICNDNYNLYETLNICNNIYKFGSNKYNTCSDICNICNDSHSTYVKSSICNDSTIGIVSNIYCMSLAANSPNKSNNILINYHNYDVKILYPCCYYYNADNDDDVVT